VLRREEETGIDKSKERMQRLRERRRAQGTMPVEVWLDAAAKAKLETLRREGESISQVIARAIDALEREQGRSDK
jgi:hypothetical protein